METITKLMKKARQEKEKQVMDAIKYFEQQLKTEKKMVKIIEIKQDIQTLKQYA